MLIEKHEKDDIISLKLRNGEEIVAKYVSDAGGGDVTVSKPFSLVMAPNGLTFQPYMLSADFEQPFTFKSDDILMMMKSSKQTNDQYISSTSKILSAKKPGIIT